MTTQTIKEKAREEFYKAEVGTPLQKILVNNFEAQKQLVEVIDSAISQAVKEREEEIIYLLNNNDYQLDNPVGKMKFINLIKYKNENTKN